MTLWTGGLLAAAWVAERLLHRWVGPGWRVALFAVVLVRVLLPVDWASPAGQLAVSHLAHLQAGLPSAATSSTPAALADTATPQAAPLVLISDPGRQAAPSPALDKPPLVSPRYQAPGWGVAALFLYGLGIAVVATRLLLSQRHLSRARRAARPARASLSAMAPDTVILEHDSVGPVAFGVVRPTILIPTGVADELSPEELRCVVAHECAHHRRRDPAVAVALVALCAAFWPVIPIWIATGRMRHLMELAADAQALRTPSITPQRFGRVLLRLADRRVPRLVGITGMATRFSQVRSRILSLRTQTQPASAVQIGLAVGISGLLLACAGVVHPEVPLLEERAAEAFAQGEYERSTQLYADLQAANPDHERACAWQREVVANAMAREDDRLIWEATDRLVEYAEDSREPGASGLESADECWNSAEETLKKAATLWHHEAATNGNSAAYVLARQAYERYAAVFDDAPDAYTLRYYQAEAVWAVASQAHQVGDDAGREASAREFARAHELFVEVAESDPSGSYFRDAVYGQLLAAKNALEPTAPASDSNPADAASPYVALPYNADDLALIAAYDRYIAAMEGADDPELAVHRLERVRIPWARYRLDDTQVLAERLVSDFDGTPQGLAAAEILTDVLTIRMTNPTKTAEERQAGHDAFAAWARRVKTLEVWGLPEATDLQSAVATLAATNAG